MLKRPSIIRDYCIDDAPRSIFAMLLVQLRAHCCAHRFPDKWNPNDARWPPGLDTHNSKALGITARSTRTPPWRDATRSAHDAADRPTRVARHGVERGLVKIKRKGVPGDKIISKADTRIIADSATPPQKVTPIYI